MIRGVMSSSRFSALRAAVASCALLITACGPSVQAPRTDESDYVFPEIRRGEATPREEKELRRAWDDVLIGRTDRAEQSLNRLIDARKDLRAAYVILGFAALRANRLSDAETTFASVLTSDPNDASAILGQ